MKPCLQPRFLTALWITFLIILGGFPSAQAAERMEKTVRLLGWKTDGSVLAFEETSIQEQQVTIKALFLNSHTGDFIKEFTVRNEEDGPDIVSVRENNLKVLLDKEGYQLTPLSQYFIGASQRGYIAPNGQYLVAGSFHFKPLVGKRGLQSVTVRLSISDLKTNLETEIAQLVLESIDGELPITMNSIGSLSIADINWSPKEDHISITIEEKRPGYRVQGVLALALDHLSPWMKEVSAQAPKPQPGPPILAKPNPEDLASSSKKPPEESMIVLGPESTPSATPVPSGWNQTKPENENQSWRLSSKTESQSTSSPAQANVRPRSTRSIQAPLPQAGKPQGLIWEASLPQKSPQGGQMAYVYRWETCGLKQSIQSGVIIENQNRVLHYSVSTLLDSDQFKLQWPSENELKLDYKKDTYRSWKLSPSLFKKQGKKSQEWYSLQAGSFESQANAGRKKDQLCQKGLPAFMVQSTEGDTRFRVWVGLFHHRDNAEDFAQKNKTSLPKTFVISY